MENYLQKFKKSQCTYTPSLHRRDFHFITFLPFTTLNILCLGHFYIYCYAHWLITALLN